MFLATTALEEFWDHTDDVVFLGPWCLDGDPERAGQVLPSPWADRARFYAAVEYVDGVYERLLGHLGAYLNDVHGTAFGNRYWRIVAGPWLAGHVDVLYDRYVLLEDAFAAYPGLQTVALDPTAFVTPRGYADATVLLNDHRFNLQLFSQLLAAAGRIFPARAPRTVSASSGRLRIDERRAALRKSRLRRRTERLLAMVVLTRGRTIDALGTSDGWRVAVDSRFRVCPGRVAWRDPVDPRPQADERRLGLARLPAADPFERSLVSTLPSSVPTVLLEGFAAARRETAVHLQSAPDLIVSETGWYENEPLKFLAAEAAERGTQLVAVQHGGGYGVYRSISHETHEERIADRFFVWGWGGDAVHRNVSSPRMTALAGRTPRSASAGPILLVMTGDFAYLNRFHSRPVGGLWDDYVDWAERFLRALPGEVRARVRIRPHAVVPPVRAARLMRLFPEVQVDPEPSFEESVAAASLSVIDHCGTAHLETLAMNAPTQLFWDRDRWEPRAAARDHHTTLADAGILRHDPEAAAAAVAGIAADPWAWWRGHAVQAARQRIAEQYAGVSVGWRRAWAAALQELLPETA